MPETTSTPNPDLTSVSSLITAPSTLAKHLGMTKNGVYRWMRVNRIPGHALIKVANFYDVELRDLLPLTGSERSNTTSVKNKPRIVLQTLMEVFRGSKTLEEAITITGQSSIALKLILTHWGDELPTLFTTLEQLDQRRIDLDEGCRRLGVTKNTLNGIRRKYGYAPGPTQRTRPLPTLPARSAKSRQIALSCIAGRFTVTEAASTFGVSARTISRAVDKLSKLSVIELASWPLVFREAYSVELEQGLPGRVQRWLEFARSSRLFVDKSPRYPETPASWKSLPLKRLLVGVLLAEDTVENIAMSIGADVSVLKTLFNGDLQPLELTYEEAVTLPIEHQLVIAEILLATMDRKRKYARQVSVHVPSHTGDDL